MDIIVALCKKNNGIGIDNKIPWYLKDDLKYFKTVTSYPGDLKDQNNIVIMGRNTFESIPDKFKPLTNRTNIVLTSKNIEYEGIIFKQSLTDALQYCKSLHFKNPRIFIIGGERLYKEAIQHEKCERLYITEIYNTYECDRFFPEIDTNKFKLSYISKFKVENDIHYRYLKYSNVSLINKFIEKKWINNEEKHYLELMKDILENGVDRNDRTNVGTISMFGKQLTFDLRDTFPLCTTKRMFVRGIFEELLLYISGKTDNKILQEKKIHIWDGNTSREFLDKRGLTEYQEGDMGETYGFNFRHYGAEYKGCQHDYTGQGFDQLENVINLIKTDPTSRRMIINLYNPSTQHKAALPACLCQYQFYVNTQKKELNLQIYLRSTDYFLANNWNACTGAFLVHLICNLNGIDLNPGDLSVITGDTHLYKSHLDAVRENLERTPKPFPKLLVLNKYDSLKEFSYQDIKIIGYDYYPNIKVDMAV